MGTTRQELMLALGRSMGAIEIATDYPDLVKWDEVLKIHKELVQVVQRYINEEDHPF